MKQKDLKTYIQYEPYPKPLALFHENCTRKTTKALLHSVCKIEKNKGKKWKIKMDVCLHIKQMCQLVRIVFHYI